MPSHCTVQLVINYWYQQHHYVTVLTAVQLVTGSLIKLYKGLDSTFVVGLMAKSLLSALRTE
jgi:uncharacterized membrane protein